MLKTVLVICPRKAAFFEASRSSKTFSQYLNVAMLKLADGDTGIEVPAWSRGDEIGDMAGAVQVFKDNAIERMMLQSESEKEQEARALRQGKVDELIADFRGRVGTLLETVTTNMDQMRATAESLSSTATQTTGQATSVAAASEEASHNGRPWPPPRNFPVASGWYPCPAPVCSTGRIRTIGSRCCRPR